MNNAVLNDPGIIGMASDDDLILAALARDGDMQAFERLYRSHVGRVYGLCLRMTANVRRAEDLTQAVFVQAWRKLSLFHTAEGSAFGPWLHRIAVNTVLTDIRATDRRHQRVTPVDNPEAWETASRQPTRGLRLDLEQAIAGLPTQARAVFVLHDVEGYQHNEIAEFLCIAVGTSKTQLHRARKLLQEALR